MSLCGIWSLGLNVRPWNIVSHLVLDRKVESCMASSTDVRDHPSRNRPDRLDLFIKELADTKAKFPDGQNAHIIREELHQIIQGLVMNLSSKYRLFQNAVVHQGGSMVEGTKIGQADEFDYVFVLPALQKQLVRERLQALFCRRLRHSYSIDEARSDDEGTFFHGWHFMPWLVWSRGKRAKETSTDYF